MKRDSEKASITVFLSLTSILFLCLICSAVESVRVQGAKVQAANIIGMGNFSVMGEFEKPLLEKYNIFSLDGSYGDGTFQIEKSEDKLRTYLLKNTNPKQDKKLSFLYFDPWNLELTDSEVTGYALLTDDSGEAFYQQAVRYMKSCAPSFLLEKLTGLFKKADDLEKWKEEYEKEKNQNEDQMNHLEEQKQEKLEQLESEGLTDENKSEAVPEPIENPLEDIAKIQKGNLMALVTQGMKVSEKTVKGKALPSKSKIREGTLKLKKENKGMASDLLFREYLISSFSDFRDRNQEGKLEYETEYLIAGADSDTKNLDRVIKQLIILREGANFAYCAGNSEQERQAGGLAAALVGFLNIPVLTAAVKYALLLAWCFGEALIDVRILLSGGKVPVWKNRDSWNLTLENLKNIITMLNDCKTDQKTGEDYEDYLRILLNIGRVSRQKMRALDLIQCNVQQKDGSRNFKVDNCIVAIETEAKWKCRSVFFNLPRAVMGAGGSAVGIRQSGSIVY